MSDVPECSCHSDGHDERKPRDVPDDFPANHISMPINADGDGPEMDEDRVTDVICWSCLETWPCTAYRETHSEDS